MITPLNMRPNITKSLDPEHVFFTSDTHFGHTSIISMCKRPFSDVNEMDEELITRWNKVVSDEDIVFHLGDFCFKGLLYWEQVRSRLNGCIYLILGNHDYNYVLSNTYRVNSLFEGIDWQMQVQVGEQKIIMQHYPLLCYAGTYRADPVWQLFGHVHSGPGSTSKDIERLVHLFPWQYDVGVDNNNYTPISFTQLKDKINGNKG